MSKSKRCGGLISIDPFSQNKKYFCTACGQPCEPAEERKEAMRRTSVRAALERNGMDASETQGGIDQVDLITGAIREPAIEIPASSSASHYPNAKVEIAPDCKISVADNQRPRESVLAELVAEGQERGDYDIKPSAESDGLIDRALAWAKNYFEDDDTPQEIIAMSIACGTNGFCAGYRACEAEISQREERAWEAGYEHGAAGPAISFAEWKQRRAGK